LRSLIAAGLVVALAGCGADTASVGSPVAGEAIGEIPASLLPDTVLDLDVTVEDVADQVATVDRSFVDAVGLFGLRADKLLKATLQVSRFNDEAEVERARFRNRVLREIGQSVPEEFRLGEERVHVTTGNRQTIAVWFRGDHMMILSVRSDYERPRTLLRELLELDPEAA
jgi:hypothetical protein